MQQLNCQLNNKKQAGHADRHIFVSPMTENISFSCDYLKQFHIENN
jgi:hypothetical protein